MIPPFFTPANVAKRRSIRRKQTLAELVAVLLVAGAVLAFVVWGMNPLLTRWGW